MLTLADQRHPPTKGDSFRYEEGDRDLSHDVLTARRDAEVTR